MKEIVGGSRDYRGGQKEIYLMLRDVCCCLCQTFTLIPPSCQQQQKGIMKCSIFQNYQPAKQNNVSPIACRASIAFFTLNPLCSRFPSKNYTQYFPLIQSKHISTNLIKQKSHHSIFQSPPHLARQFLTTLHRYLFSFIACPPWKIKISSFFYVIGLVSNLIQMGKLPLLVLFALLAVGWASDWQSYGNFTSDNITQLFQFMDAGIDKAGNGEIQQYEICKYMSDELNKLWDKAWNVFVFGIGDSPTIDAIIYGYAFREHWFWYNNYGEGQYTFIIWKDYNCQDNWVSFQPYSPQSNFDKPITDAIAAYTGKITDAIFNDPWKFGFELVTAVQSSNTGAFSVVVTQGSPTLYSATICVLLDGTTNQYEVNTLQNSDNSQQLIYFIMKMR